MRKDQQGWRRLRKDHCIMHKGPPSMRNDQHGRWRLRKDHCISKEPQAWERISNDEKGSARMRKVQQEWERISKVRKDQQGWERISKDEKGSARMRRLRKDHCTSKDPQAWVRISKIQGGSGRTIASARILKHEKGSASMRKDQQGWERMSKEKETGSCCKVTMQNIMLWELWHSFPIHPSMAEECIHGSALAKYSNHFWPWYSYRSQSVYD
jgi:hypothetical protein